MTLFLVQDYLTFAQCVLFITTIVRLIMQNLIWLLIALSACCFVLAAIQSVWHFTFIGVQPEGFSSASTNLALLTIALLLVLKKKANNEVHFIEKTLSRFPEK